MASSIPKNQKANYEGPGSKNPLAFKHCNATEGIEGRTVKDWLRFSVGYWPTLRRDAKMREQNFKFLRWAFGVALGLTFAAIFLQGLHLFGFSLEPPLLYFLGTATVGEIAGLFAMVLKYR